MRPKHDTSLRTLPAMLEKNAAEDPDRPFVIDEVGTLSRAETLALARQTAGAFDQLGVARGETVAIMLDNRRELLASWFGLACRGAIEVPISPASVGEHLVHTLNHSRCRTAVVAAELVGRLGEVAEGLERLERLIVVGDATSEHFETVPWAALPTGQLDYSAGVSFSDPVARPLHVRGHRPRERGDRQPRAPLHERLPTDSAVRARAGRHDLFLPAPPPQHGAGLRRLGCDRLGSNAPACTALRRRHVLARRPSARRHGAPVSWARCSCYSPSAPNSPTTRTTRSGLGSACRSPPRCTSRSKRDSTLDLVHCYGSTEATIVAWQNRAERVIGSVGPTLPGYEIAILDADDRPLAPGEVGQICTRPDDAYSMFSGYFREPERTVAAFRNLWFHTGDRGSIDDAGNLWFSDRMGDVIRRLGESVSSWEVEQVVLAHPAVQLACAFGVPSELIEEEVMVAAVVRGGFELTATELREWCAARLPRYATPRFIEFVETLPLTPTGKIEKFKLKDRGVTETTDDARSGRAAR